MRNRVQKIIANAGIMSRRRAEEYISAGRVTLLGGGKITLGMTADDETDTICIDGQPITAGRKEYTYLMLNKLPGYVTTMSDEQGRKTVCELVADCGARVYPVGRLDMFSEGLLLLTDDGEFANRMMHPSHGMKKTYRVTVTGDNIRASAEKLKKPLLIDGYRIRPAQVMVLPEENVLEVTISEGRNRQIRKMCGQCGLTVKRLVRIREGVLELGDLKPGKWRRLTAEELTLLQAAADGEQKNETV